jgi:hypothetical protein
MKTAFLIAVIVCSIYSYGQTKHTQRKPENKWHCQITSAFFESEHGLPVSFTLNCDNVQNMQLNDSKVADDGPPCHDKDSTVECIQRDVDADLKGCGAAYADWKWMPSAYWVKGTIICDSNHHYELAVTEHVSGSYEPNWSQYLHGASSDLNWMRIENPDKKW